MSVPMNVLTEILEFLGLAKAATHAKLPAPLPVAWMGVDRECFPGKTTVNKKRPCAHGSDDAGWMKLLIENSNLRLSGAYLEGPALAGANLKSGKPAKFTHSSTETPRDWVKNVAKLQAQGWGIVFWYVGYSVGGNEPMPAASVIPSSDYESLGRCHAKHAKTIVSNISPSMEGAVVYLDNEDGEKTPVASLDKYYKAFFEELQTPDPSPSALPTLRPGIYAHRNPAKHFLNLFPYLFVWQTWVRKADFNTSTPPFSTAAKPLYIHARKPTHPKSKPSSWIRPLDVTVGSHYPTIWPAGQQFYIYSKKMPKAGSAAASSSFIPLESWDYDSSLVRDPSYPAANPRLATGVASGSSDPVVAQGNFTPASAPGTHPSHPPLMTVALLTPSGSLSVGPAGSLPRIEPESPIAAATLPSALQSSFASFLTGGEVAVFNSSDPFSLLAVPMGVVAARRLRALAHVFYSSTDEQIFFIGRDPSIAPHWAVYGLRNSGGAWGAAPHLVGGPLRVHPFAMLAAAARSGTSVEVFTIDEAGALQASSWDPLSLTWPSPNSQPIAPPGAFLPMSALAAVSADPHTMVFGIGSDLRLEYLEFINAPGSPPVWPLTLGSATDLVSPHSRIAVQARSATRIEVAVMTDDGRVRLHALEKSGSVWEEPSHPKHPFDAPLDPPLAVSPSGTPPSLSPGMKSAIGWAVNPYGDLALGVVSGDTMVFTAGLTRGTNAGHGSAGTAVLRYSAAKKWERYP